MFKNYLKTAWRNLRLSRFYSLINIGGLAVGLATGIMLLLWVRNERSFDRFHTQYRDIYQLSAHFTINGKPVTWTGVPGPLKVMGKSIPQVESIVRTYEERGQVLVNPVSDKLLDGNVIASVDSTFFTIFDFKLLEGSQASLFPNTHSIVLTRSMANRLFDNKEALGQTVAYQKTNFTVTGILEDFPQNSSLHYDAIVPMGYYEELFTRNGGNGDWKTIDEDMGDYSFDTYVKLREGTSPRKTGSDFSIAYNKARNGTSRTSFELEPLADIHLIAPDGNDSALKMVKIFSLVAFLLLLIAGINYVNLSTARSLIRAREVGVRKIVGASRKQLFLQFIIETFLLFLVSTILALVLIKLLMPLYNNISGKDLTFSLMNGQAWRVIGIAILGTLLASSIYPALVLSSFNPLQSLKGSVVSGLGTVFFRKILVVFQFAISVALIASTLVIGRQLQYVRHKSLGYNKSYVFTVAFPGNATNHWEAIKHELSKQPGVVNVATSGVDDISSLTSSTGDISWQGKPADRDMIISQAPVGQDFIPTMQISFLEGHNLTGTPADSSHYILNEAAVREMGLKPPYVGQPVSFHEHEGIIWGVVKDFNFRSLKEKVSPLILFSSDWGHNIFYIRTTASGAQNAIAAVERQYKQYAGDIPFSYNFVDKQFEAKYRSDQRTGALFRLFAGIAVFISCLGLLGLATFMAQRRTREIGVRKVLGASLYNIVRLLTREFVVLVLIAIIIATPLVWIGMNKWLDDFAYRINMGWGIFLTAGCMVVVIALATVCFQTLKAAMANPVNSLRTE